MRPNPTFRWLFIYLTTLCTLIHLLQQHQLASADLGLKSRLPTTRTATGTAAAAAGKKAPISPATRPVSTRPIAASRTPATRSHVATSTATRDASMQAPSTVPTRRVVKEPTKGSPKIMTKSAVPLQSASGNKKESVPKKDIAKKNPSTKDSKTKKLPQLPLDGPPAAPAAPAPPAAPLPLLMAKNSLPPVPTKAPQVIATKPLELANIFQDQKVISLGQAAKLMHELVKDAYDLELRCELYLDLIKQRNSRTEVGVANLIRKSANKLSRPDLDSLNLKEKLEAELNYGALKKVRIFQASFDDEFAEFVEEDMEEVKNDLFDCVAHAADRHQKAMLNVGEFVADTIEQIEPIVYASRHALERIEEAKQAVSRIELSKIDKTDKRGEWLEAYKILFVMIINNRYRLTQELMGFMTTPDSLDILDFMVDMNEQINVFKNQLVHRESRLLNKNKSFQKSRNYKDELLKMFILASRNLDWLPKRSISFTHQRTRWRIIRNTIVPFNGLSLSDVTWSPARTIHRNTFEALIESCPFYGDYFEYSIRNLHFHDNSIEPDTARWLVERLYPFALGCRSLEADKKRLPQIRDWYIFSISQKIQRWCLERLNDPSLADEDKIVVLSIMRLIP